MRGGNKASRLKAFDYVHSTALLFIFTLLYTQQFSFFLKCLFLFLPSESEVIFLPIVESEKDTNVLCVRLRRE